MEKSALFGVMRRLRHSSKKIHQTNINVVFPSHFPHGSTARYVLFFCNALMAPGWRISVYLDELNS